MTHASGFKTGLTEVKVYNRAGGGGARGPNGTSYVDGAVLRSGPESVGPLEVQAFG